MNAQATARSIAGNEDALAEFEAGLLDVPVEVAEALDELIAARRRNPRDPMRTAVSVFERLRDDALAEDDLSPLRRARLTHNGGAGMSVAALALLAGVSSPTVWRAETGGALVSTRTWGKLARALSVPVDSIRPR